MLVALNVRKWKGNATDREIAAQAELSANAEMGTMTVIKQLTPKHLIQPINTIARLGREEHYKTTVPGLFRGQALLPTRMFETYMATQADIKENFFQAVDSFIRMYPTIREKAKDKLGRSYRERDFPSIDAIRSYFDYSIQTGPVPEVSDWRLDGVNQSDIASLRSEVEDSVKEMYREAHKTMMERTKTVLESMYRQASNYSLDAPGAMLRDATIDQMKELSEIVCDMNVTDDPILDKIGKEMVKQFGNLSGAELRKSAELRSDIASKAKKLLDQMSGAKIKRAAA